MAKCPFDGFECEVQTKRIKEWKRAVQRAAEERINKVFFTSANMFDNCQHTGTCIRYINLMKQPPQKTK